ncbi:hypothetical protein [Halobacteriovorax sp.]|uniref:hypothetical protein n=1 Tax=Halobacteriovorax sp. TaxID=2020862 RepID=UPI003AF2251F
MKIRESVLKARSYFSKRDKLLSYADFSNFKQQHLELKRNKKSLEFSRSGSYLNSLDSLRGAGTNGNISYLNVFILSYAVKV